MHPFYFGSSSRRLFGVYEPATASRPKPRAAVLCHPWGPEYLHAHRSMRQLAKQLTDAGVHTLRFDYFATGDSAGDDGEGDLEAWRQDVLTAVEELTSLSGASRVTLVGLRLGATLAALAAAEVPTAVERVVLWDPVVNGASYAAEMLGVCRAQPIPILEPVRRPEDIGGGIEILGFPLTSQVLVQLDGLHLAHLAERIPCRVEAVVSQSDAACEQVRVALSPSASHGILRIESPPIWLEDWPRNSGYVPVKILQQIVQWVS